MDFITDWLKKLIRPPGADGSVKSPTDKADREYITRRKAAQLSRIEALELELGLQAHTLDKKDD